MLRSTFSVSFFLKKLRAKKNGSCPIICRITINGLRSEFSTNEYVLPENWDSTKNRLIGKTEELKQVNFHLSELVVRIHEIHRDLQVKGKRITADFLRSKVRGQAENDKTILKCFQYHNEHMKTKIGIEFSQGSLKNYEVTYRFLCEFIRKKYGCDDLDLLEMNHEFLVNYEVFLSQNKTTKHNGTIKHIQRIKKVMNMAIRNEWIDKNPFAKYVCRLKKFNREYLDKNELEIIENIELNNKKLEMVRDVFIFSVYTGYAFADVQLLSPENIKPGNDNHLWAYVYRAKTNVSCNIRLLPPALKILEKYMSLENKKDPSKIFPIYSNQKTNQYLKDVAKLAGINKKMSFHMARHTFATTVTLTNGVPLETVSKMLGHTNLKTTQIYSRVIEEKVSEDMGKLSKRLFHQEEKIETPKQEIKIEIPSETVSDSILKPIYEEVNHENKFTYTYSLNNNESPKQTIWKISANK